VDISNGHYLFISTIGIVAIDHWCYGQLELSYIVIALVGGLGEEGGIFGH